MVAGRAGNAIVAAIPAAVHAQQAGGGGGGGTRSKAVEGCLRAGGGGPGRGMLQWGVGAGQRAAKQGAQGAVGSLLQQSRSGEQRRVVETGRGGGG